MAAFLLKVGLTGQVVDGHGNVEFWLLSAGEERQYQGGWRVLCMEQIRYSTCAESDVRQGAVQDHWDLR